MLRMCSLTESYVAPFASHVAAGIRIPRTALPRSPFRICPAHVFDCDFRDGVVPISKSKKRKK
jgi:hypothetical protein